MSNNATPTHTTRLARKAAKTLLIDLAKQVPDDQKPGLLINDAELEDGKIGPILDLMLGDVQTFPALIDFLRERILGPYPPAGFTAGHPRYDRYEKIVANLYEKAQIECALIDEQLRAHLIVRSARLKTDAIMLGDDISFLSENDMAHFLSAARYAKEEGKPYPIETRQALADLLQEAINFAIPRMHHEDDSVRYTLKQLFNAALREGDSACPVFQTACRTLNNPLLSDLKIHSLTQVLYPSTVKDRIAAMTIGSPVQIDLVRHWDEHASPERSSHDFRAGYVVSYDPATDRSQVLSVIEGEYFVEDVEARHLSFDFDKAASFIDPHHMERVARNEFRVGDIVEANIGGWNDDPVRCTVQAFNERGSVRVLESGSSGDVKLHDWFPRGDVRVPLFI